MKKLFNDPFFNVIDDLFMASDMMYSPQVKINKTDSEYLLAMSVPGLTKEDLKISVKEHELEINFDAMEHDNKKLFVSSFSKKYILPEFIQEDDITGKVENGVLELKIPLIKKRPTERYISLN